MIYTGLRKDEMRGIDKNTERFFKCSAVLLLATAATKLYSASGQAKILWQIDRVLHLNFRVLMVGAALLEMAIAGFLWQSRDDALRALALLWLSGNFIFYRFAPPVE